MRIERWLQVGVIGLLALEAIWAASYWKSRTGVTGTQSNHIERSSAFEVSTPIVKPWADDLFGGMSTIDSSNPGMDAPPSVVTGAPVTLHLSGIVLSSNPHVTLEGVPGQEHGISIAIGGTLDSLTILSIGSDHAMVRLGATLARLRLGVPEVLVP